MFQQGRLIREYKLIAPLGSGGMGAVWKAENVHLGTICAIKVMTSPDGQLVDEQSGERFLQEARVQAQLAHANIVKVSNFFIEGGCPFMVMDFVNGTSLAKQIQMGGPLSVGQALSIGIDVLDALDWAHSHSVVHRDVKPANILLTSGRAMLTDFGISLVGGASRLTKAHYIIGTPQYMSPEQTDPLGRIDGRSDQYSLACVLYEMLVGWPPFSGMDDEAVMLAHRKWPVPEIAGPDLPPGLNAALSRALTKEPQQRYAKCSDLSSALRTLRSSLSPASGRTTLVSEQAHAIPTSSCGVAPTEARPSPPKSPAPGPGAAPPRPPKLMKVMPLLAITLLALMVIAYVAHRELPEPNIGSSGNVEHTGAQSAGQESPTNTQVGRQVDTGQGLATNRPKSQMSRDTAESDRGIGRPDDEETAGSSKRLRESIAETTAVRGPEPIVEGAAAPVSVTTTPAISEELAGCEKAVSEHRFGRGELECLKAVQAHPDAISAWVSLASIYAHTGDDGAALDQLRRARAIADRSPQPDAVWKPLAERLRSDPSFSLLRNDPAFEDIVKE